LSVSFSGTGTHLFCCFDEHFEDYRYYLLDLAGADFRVADVRKSRGGYRVIYVLSEGA